MLISLPSSSSLPSVGSARVPLASVLPPSPSFSSSDRDFFRRIGGEASSETPSEIVADAWHALQMPRFGDFLTGRERFGLLEVRRFESLDRLLEPLGAKKAGDPALVSHLERMLKSEAHPELALSVYEYRFLGDVIREPSNRLLHIVSIFLQRIEAALGDRLPLVDVRTEEWEGDLGQQTYVGRLAVRLLSPRLFQRAVECLYPEKNLRFDYRPSEYEGGCLRSMRRHNVLGTTLPWETTFLKDVAANVPAWFYRLHDDYHNSDQILIPEETKTALDRFSDLLEWIRPVFSGTKAEAGLLSLLSDFADDRESAYRHTPKGALEKIWSLIALYYLVLPVADGHWMNPMGGNERMTAVLLRKRYQEDKPLSQWTAEFFARSSRANQEAYRRAVDYMLRKAERFPDADASHRLSDFFLGVKSYLPVP